MLIKTERIRTKIISASVYPCIVLGIVCIVLLIMFLVVIPTFVDIYKQMGVELPLLTQIMVAISNALKNGWFISFPILGFSLWGVIKYLRSPSGKRMIDNIILKVPILGPLMQYVYNSRFISTLAVSFRAGLPITEALALAASTVSHSKMRSAFQRVNLKIQAGQSLVVSLSQTNYVPELVLIMISTGQESGELDKMLATAYDYLEEEVNHRVEILMTFMEPALLLVLGVVIGFVAMAIYLPMFGVYENL
jgi:type II secretory pathway component PulF